MGVARMLIAATVVVCAVLFDSEEGAKNRREDARTVATDTAEQQNPREAAHRYVGSKKCRMCHSEHHESWLDRPAGNSWDALLPGTGIEMKRASGLDPERNYTADVRCLACHSVGYGKLDGYAIPNPNDGKSRRHAAVRQGVGCEACHGPGGGYVEVMKDIRRNRRAYELRELHAAGLVEIGPETCNACHNDCAVCMPPQRSETDGDNADSINVTKVDSYSAHETFPPKWGKP